ncbi:MAG: cupin domain-containing protein [Saccharofermentanales bacterium]
MTDKESEYSGRIFNLYQGIPDKFDGEVAETLLEDSDVRIERIISRGHSSPPGFWYEQDEEEWVLLLKGCAVLEFTGGRTAALREGDSILIHAGERHRVASTTAEPACVWLCVFVG